MADTVVVQMTRAGSFLVPCPHCGRGREFPSAGASVPTENPFTFRCVCGGDVRVRMNLRQSIRKRVRLTASVVIGLRRPEACTVENISRTGLQFSLPATSVVKLGQRAVVTVVLNDRQQSKLSLPGTVRRVTTRADGSVVGVEFGSLPPYESQALAFYLM